MCATATAAAQLRYSVTEPVVLHDGAGSSAFTLTNVGTTALPLGLRIGPFTDDTSQMALAAPKVTFALQAGGPLPFFMLPGATLRVEANVGNLSGAGVASAPLFNGNFELGRLQVVEANAPLDISISGKGGTDQRLAMTDGENAEVTLKNNDATAYPLDWSFQIDGRVLQSGELQLGPQGTSRIDLLPTDDLYLWTDYVRPSDKTGQLLLSLHGPPEVAREVLPERTLQVSLLMQRLNPSWTSFWSHVFVTLILLLGGLLSLVGNSVLPNILRKIHLRRRINDLANGTDGISTRVDAYLRMLLRMERKRIGLLLDRSWAISPSSTERLEAVAAAIDRLAKRLKVAERLDEIRRKLEDISPTAPPSVTEDIDSKLQMAATHLYSFVLTDEDVNAANRILDTEAASLATVGDTDALARMIATNFRDLKVRQKFLPYSYYNDLKAAIPGLFELLNQPFDDFRNIPRQMIFAIDYGIAAIQMAFDYAIMRASTPAAAAGVVSVSVSGSVSGSGTGNVQSSRERLIVHQKELIGLLGTLSWPALRELRALIQEMRENIYEQDVLEEIGTPGQAKIAFDPRTVRAYLPVLFSIRFKDPRFNDAAAIRRLTCKWDFPNETLDQDWKICHFFRGNEMKRGEGRDVTVSVRVESQKAVEAAASAGGKEAARPLRNALSATIEVLRAERPSYSRAFAEAVRFFIAFGVALAALLSGALQQIEKLDFIPATIAILALGFGVDSIKNLLIQTSRRAAS
jgi:hypothetical protein